MTELDPRLEPTGDCYVIVGQAITGFGSKAKWTLVHGRPTLQREPYIEYGHGWLESPDGEICWDPIMEGEFPKILYYAAGNIDPKQCLRYTQAEARRWIIKTKHWGPWEGPDGVEALDE